MKLIYTTFSDKSEVERICKNMIKENLAACAHVLSKGESFYAWQGKLVADTEYVVLFKTSDDKAPLLMREIEKAHSYETPCVLEINIDNQSQGYNNWLTQTLK